MKYRPLPSREILESLFEWDDTGSLKWKIKIDAKINNSGQSGNINTRGYCQIQINKIVYLKHRLLYLLYHNIDPMNNLVDHIDGNVMNNAKTNLRLGNQSKNMQNTKLFCTNTSGCKGVSYYKRDKMWECSIIINKNKIHLGKYRSFIYACVVRKRAAKLYFGDWRRE